MIKFKCIQWFTLLLLVSCGTESGYRSWMAPNGKLKVLSTIAMIDDLVKQVGADHVDAIALIKGELDPHSYQLVKGDDEKLARADIVFYNGLGLEHGPSLQNYLEKNSKAVGLGDKLREKDSNLILHYQGQIDPHIWMDADLWSRTLPWIVEALSKSDPAHADVFHANAARLKESMARLHQEIYDELQTIPEAQRYLVTSHDAFNYFTRAYLAEPSELADKSWQKRFAAPEGLAPESQLSTHDIQAIIDHVSLHKIHILFPESNVSKDSIRKIVDAAREKGMQLKIASDYLYADAMGKPGSDGDTYIKMLSHNGKMIARYLRNNYP